MRPEMMINAEVFKYTTGKIKFVSQRSEYDTRLPKLALIIIPGVYLMLSWTSYLRYAVGLESD